MEFNVGDIIKIKEGVESAFYSPGDTGIVQETLWEGAYVKFSFVNMDQENSWLVGYEDMEKIHWSYDKSRLEAIASKTNPNIASALAGMLKDFTIPSFDIVLVDHMELTPTKPITTIEGAVERIKELQSEIIVNDEYAKIRVAIIKDEIDRMLDLILELKEE